MTTNREASVAQRVVVAVWLIACTGTAAGVHAQSAGPDDKSTHQEPGVVQKVGGAVERGVKAAASGVDRGARAAARGAKKAGDAVERGAKAAGSAVGRGAKKIGVPTETASAPKR